MWYVIEGHDGDDVLAARLQARGRHLERLIALRDAGRLLLAGPCPRIDAEDPEGAEIALLGAAVPVREGQGAEHGLGGSAVQPSPPTPVPFRLLEDLLPSLAGLRPALGARHDTSLLLASLWARGEARPSVTRPRLACRWQVAGTQDAGDPIRRGN